MTSAPDEHALAQLLEAARRETVERFEKEVAEGTRDAQAELAEYRRQQRDYTSLLRMNMTPEEAKVLAHRLLQTHNLVLHGTSLQSFEREVAQLLIRLYDDFIARTTNQGSR